VDCVSGINATSHANVCLSIPSHHLLPGKLLLGDLLLLFLLLWLGHDLFPLRQDELHVARAAHVGIDATVSTVCPPPHLGCSVDLDVLDDQRVDVQTLVLGIAFSVLEKLEQELSTLLGPSTLGVVPGLGLSLASDASVEPAEGNALLLHHDILEEAHSLADMHVLDGLSSLTSVLEVDPQVGTPGLA